MTPAPKLGELIYSKKIYILYDEAILEYGTEKGRYYMSVLVGVAPDRKTLPTPNQFVMLLAQAGLADLADMEDCLGKENTEKFVKYVKEKYGTKRT